MKNKKPLLLKVSLTLASFSFAVVSLASCQRENNLPRISYGSYIFDRNYRPEVYNFTDMVFKSGDATPNGPFSLEDKVNAKETFIVTTISKAGFSCGTCFDYLTEVVKPFIQIEKIPIFLIQYDEFNNAEDTYGLKQETLTLSLNIFIDGELKHRETDDKNDQIFVDSRAFTKFVFERVSSPFIFDVDQERIDTLLKTSKEFMMYYAQTGCPDCADVETRVLHDYNPKKNGLIVYRFDTSTLATEEKDPFKAKYGLSNVNTTKFGYEQGFVPTFHMIDSSLGNTPDKYITDAAVYLNDQLTLKAETNKWAITRTFWTEERIQVLGNWAKSDKIVPLLGKEFADRTDWSRSNAAPTHAIYLTEFLNYYLQ